MGFFEMIHLSEMLIYENRPDICRLEMIPFMMIFGKNLPKFVSANLKTSQPILPSQTTTRTI